MGAAAAGGGDVGSMLEGSFVEDRSERGQPASNAAENNTNALQISEELCRSMP
jgi:hypothetical protein